MPITNYYLAPLLLLFCFGCKKNTVEIVDSSLNKRLNSIGQYEGSSYCTATYIEIPNQHIDSPAYVITNGHCTAIFYDDNKIDVDIPLNATIIFNLIQGDLNKQIKFNTKKIAYSTMKGTDIAIIELNHSNRALQNQGIFPVPLEQSLPALGTKISAYGYPLKYTPVVLQQTTGKLSASSTVAEFIWFWNKLYSADFPNISSGSSGSPVFTDVSKGLWGIINTTTIDGIGVCELGSPCEFIAPNQPTVKKNVTYIVDVTKLKDCFNAKGSFDIHSDYFPFGKPTDFFVSFPNSVRNFNANTALNSSLIFNIDNPQNTSYKIELFEEYNPENKSGFIPILANQTQTKFPTKEGFYIISVLKNNRFDQMNYLTFKMDFTPPNLNLIELNQTQSAESTVINPVFVYPELTQFYWKYGAQATCNCEDNKDFEIYNRIPKNIAKAELPVKVCIKGVDLAGNTTSPKEFIIK